LAGAGLAMFGLGCLVATAVLVLDLTWAAWTAALVVGLALFVIAGTAALMGRSQMRQSTPPVPREAIDSTKQDIEALKGHRR
jgi:Putative Actinobacterial Holin-X, holin superfamily III